MGQFARPVTLVSDGGWTASSGVDLPAMLDETSPNGDTDYVTRTGVGTLEVKLGAITDPGHHLKHVVRVNARSMNGASAAETLNVQLFQGTTLIAQSGPVALGRNAYNTGQFTLTEAEAAAITDYSDLRLRFVPVQAAGETMRITWAELEVPFTVGQARNQIDTWLEARWPQILARQDAYALAHGGRYWQGLVSHSLDPEDGEESAPDQLTLKPHYQAEDWAEMGSLPASWPMVMWFDQYKTPDGEFGFVGYVRGRLHGRIWQRAQNGRGPETWRTYDWQDVTPDEEEGGESLQSFGLSSSEASSEPGMEAESAFLAIGSEPEPEPVLLSIDEPPPPEVPLTWWATQTEKAKAAGQRFVAWCRHCWEKATGHFR